MEQLRDGAVPAKLDVFRLHQRRMVDPGGPQGIPPVNQNHLFGNAAEEHGVCGGGVAASHDYHRLALVAHPVAGSAVGHTPAGEGSLVREAQRSGIGAGGQHHGSAVEGALTGLQNLGRGGEIHALHLGIRAFGAETLRLPLHLLRQGEAVDSILKTGIVVDLLRQGHLPAGRELLQHQSVQPRPGCVEGRSVAAGAAAHYDQIVNMDPAHGFRLLTLPELPG